MVIESKLTSNYLTKNHFSYGLIISLFVISLCFVFSSIYWNNSLELAKYLAASPSLIFEKHEYWRLFTTTLVHGDLKHLASNSLMLSIMSYYITSHYGAWVFPTLSLLAGAIINYVVLLSFKSDISLVGISGVVYFLWGFWLVLYFFIQRNQTLTSRLLRISGVGVVILFPTSLTANVSYLAHFAGLVIGIIFAAFYFIINRKYIYSFERNEHVVIRDFEQELKEESNLQND